MSAPGSGGEWRAVVLALCCAVLLAGGCGAPAVLEEGLRVERAGDLVASHWDLVVRDSVAGDVMATGGAVTFTGYSAGDLLVAAGNQMLAGVVVGSVRAAGGRVRVDTEVGRNLTLAGGEVVVGRGARVAGNVYLVGGRVHLGGVVEHLARIAAAEVVLDGVVSGDVLVEARRLRLGPGAVVEGDLRYRLGRGERLEVDPGARVGGDVLRLGPRRGAWLRWALRALRVAGFLLAGAVVVALLPGLALASERRVGARPLASTAAGLFLLLLVPLLVVVAAVTVVGIPLALVTAVLYAVLVYLAPAVVALWLGRRLLGGSSYPERGDLAVAFVTGGLILGVLGLIPLVGLAVRAVATVLGLGALVVALWEGAVRVEPGPRSA
jgi:cytoskeletal protein CcmA (bactofilin family)